MSLMPSGGGGGGGNEPPRQPRDLTGLLRFCVQATSAEDASGSSNQAGMDPERRRWLEEAINSMTVNPIQEMAKAIETIQKGLAKMDDQGSNSEEILDEIEPVIESITDFVSSSDLANDFHKIGGFDILLPLLRLENDAIRSKTCDLVAELTQNNPYCQREALNINLLPILVRMLDDDSMNEAVQIKSLYAISALVRSNINARDKFVNECDGFSVLMRTIQKPVLKLRIKSSFLLGDLISNAEYRETLHSMGFVEQLIALIHMDHDESHQYLLYTLDRLLSNHEPAVKEVQSRPELGLKTVLQQRIELLQGKSEHLEEVSSCQKLLDLCFPGQAEAEDPTIESER